MIIKNEIQKPQEICENWVWMRNLCITWYLSRLQHERPDCFALQGLQPIYAAGGAVIRDIDGEPMLYPTPALSFRLLYVAVDYYVAAAKRRRRDWIKASGTTPEEAMEALFLKVQSSPLDEREGLTPEEKGGYLESPYSRTRFKPRPHVRGPQNRPPKPRKNRRDSVFRDLVVVLKSLFGLK